jgi:hypothetical protein
MVGATAAELVGVELVAQDRPDVDLAVAAGVRLGLPDGEGGKAAGSALVWWSGSTNRLILTSMRPP